MNVRTAQAITFPQPATPAQKGSTATLSATGGPSGNPVTFAITGGTGSATLSGANNSTITYTGVGTVQITASQAGDTGANGPAPDVSQTVTVQTSLGSLRISGYASAPTGVAQSFTVTAYDQTGAVYPGFTGAVSFSNSDSTAVLPASYTFTGSDAGAHTFSLTLKTAGSQTLTVTSGGLSVSQSIVSPGYVLLLSGSNYVAKQYETGASVFTSTGGGTPNSGLATDSLGRAYSVNSANNVLVRFGPAGNAQSGTGFTGGGLSSPKQVALDGAGAVWITNSTGSVTVFAPAGPQTSASVAVSPATGYAGPYATPTGIAIDISGNVWVANAGDNTVTEVLGAAAPTVPPSTSLLNNTVGVRP